MARQGYPLEAHMGAVKILTGSITLGSSAIASQTLTTRGIGTAVRNSAGDYTITLADGIKDVEDVNISIMAATAADLQPQLTAISVSSRTIQFRVLAAATPTDGASGVVIRLTIIVREM